jgi:hypothetical protein
VLDEWHIMLSEDPALGNLEARWHSMNRFDNYRQIVVPRSLAIESLGAPAEVAGLARDLNEELADLVPQHPDLWTLFI